MLKHFAHILLAGILVFVSCDKKNKKPSEETEDPPAAIDTPPKDTSFECQDLPILLPPFAWIDSVPELNKAINAFLYDPIDPNRILYVANGDIPSYNNLFLYTIPTGQIKHLCTLGTYLPQVNKKGWITFNDVENNVYVLKDNRDVPIQLTNNKRSVAPQWDHSGNYVYYFREGFGIYPARIEKVSTTGELTADVPADMPYAASFKNSDKIIVMEVKTTSTCKLILRNPNNLDEDRELLSGPLYSKQGQINFDDLVVDTNEEWFYWSNSNGIFRCNIASLAVDTLLKNCPNAIYSNPMISFKDNELTYSQHIMKPLSSITLLHQYKAMEMNLLTKASQEVKLFP